MNPTTAKAHEDLDRAYMAGDLGKVYMMAIAALMALTAAEKRAPVFVAQADDATWAQA